METRGWGSQYKYAMEFGKEFTAQEVRDLEFVFKTFDGEGRGLIQAEEVRKALGHLAFKVSRKAVQLLLKDLELVNSKSASRNTAGSTDFEGFLHIVAKLQGISCDHYDEIIKAFKVLDSDKDGFINSVDLRKYASLVGLASADVEDMIQEADRDGDGKINKEEFISIMKQTNLFVRSR